MTNLKMPPPRPRDAAPDGASHPAAWRAVGRRDLLLDSAIALVLTALLVTSGVVFVELPAMQGLPPPTAITFVSGALTCLVIALRRVYPLTVLVVAATTFTVYGFNGAHEATATSVALFLATVSAGSHGRAVVRDWVRGIVIAALFGTIVYAFATSDQTFSPVTATWLQVYSLVLNAFYFGAAWVLGDQIRLRARREADLSARTAELSARTLELEAERERSAEQAAMAERLRIARELHDVLGHHVSVMGVQAGAARRILDRDPGQASQALTAIEGSSRQAVMELQRVLRLLREHDEDGRGPLRELERLDDLADEVRRAGLTVALQLGDLPDLPTDIELAAIRVIQESLTNSLRHAGPGSSVWIKVGTDAVHLVCEVTDDGRGNPPTDHRADGGHGTSRGTGLRGLRERVALHGGTFAAGPIAPRGWQVRACIPLDGRPDEDHGADPSATAPSPANGERKRTPEDGPTGLAPISSDDARA